MSFSYKNGDRVLTNLNLEIEAGKTVAITGPSAGKTTPPSNPRFYDISEGQILIDGRY